LNKPMQTALGREMQKSEKLSSPLSLLYWAFYFPARVILTAASSVGEIVQKRREASFTSRMREAGRFMEWRTFAQELKSGHGTAIIECFSFPGSTRIWWTAEELSPSDGLHTGVLSEYSMDQACDFCAQIQSLYTNPENGKAHLVACLVGKDEEYRMKLESVTGARHITMRGSVTPRKFKS
jgi:hypothetical protein